MCLSKDTQEYLKLYRIWLNAECDNKLLELYRQFGETVIIHH